MSSAIYNSVRAAIESRGGSDAMVRAVCDVVGDEIAGAVQDALTSYCGDPQPRWLGHTELEASMRWCPLAREATPVGKGKKDAAIGNRFIDSDGSDYANPAGCRCIGSYCMAWRWLDATRGHCGLSGPPVYQPIGEPRRLPDRTPLERPTASEQADLFDPSDAES